MMDGKWIWLPESSYPNDQVCQYRAGITDAGYTVVSITKEYEFCKRIQSVELHFSGDTFFRLFCNGRYVATGPATVGGDFLPTKGPYDWYYFTACELRKERFPDFGHGKLSFSALVRKSPVKGCDFSKGHGGFCLTGRVYFEDGSVTDIFTDETWRIKRENAYVRPNCYNENIPNETEVYAEAFPDIWNAQLAPIPPCTEYEMKPIKGRNYRVAPHSEVRVEIEFDKIYAGYIYLQVQSSIYAKLHYYETSVCNAQEEIRLISDREYRGIDFHSVGRIEAILRNDGEEVSEGEISLIVTHYPIEQTATTKTSDRQLNEVFEVCSHSLKYCRQTHHLDSPLHCEPLACTGDYYIETLMTVFTFGDLRLSKFDVQRTAELFRSQDGRIFHTSYSLIWTLMLWDVYRYTGDVRLLEENKDALGILLKRFSGYIGENGLLEKAPNYMFVDWLNPDGIDLHHPPKALGQTCLNMFYYGALQTAAKIYERVDMQSMVMDCKDRAEKLRQAMLEWLWDAEKGLFFEGLNTPTAEELVCDLMPQNIEKRYYRKHGNILATYFGVFDKAMNRKILNKVMSDNSLGKVQPYFMHFLLEAIYRNDLREDYTLKLLEEWKPFIVECPKGLPEGFHKPNDEYVFDHSHAWAGTPAYALPLALTGFEMIKAGFEEICFSPCLLGLVFAEVEIPTPKGMIKVILQKDRQPQITVPKGIKYSLMK